MPLLPAGLGCSFFLNQFSRVPDLPFVTDLLVTDLLVPTCDSVQFPYVVERWGLKWVLPGTLSTVHKQPQPHPRNPPVRVSYLLVTLSHNPTYTPTAAGAGLGQREENRVLVFCPLLSGFSQPCTPWFPPAPPLSHVTRDTPAPAHSGSEVTSSPF